jgi:prepilin-type processing-associated H-X9-DG protein
VAVTHLKSKGSSCDDVGDPDTGDGQGNCNLTRTAAAKAMADWLAGDPTESGDPDVLIVGDLNSYAMETPVEALQDKGYKDLIETYLAPAEQYSYVFFGQAGYLDHGLANMTLAPQVSGVTVWHINSDEPNALDYNNYNQPSLYQPGPYRSSDHDPVLVGLDLGEGAYTVYFPVIASGYGADFLYVDGHVRPSNEDGLGLVGVKIYRSIASYPGEVVAITNENGYYWAEPLNTQGHQETLSMWAEMPSYSFDPDAYLWVYYGYGGEMTLDFVATGNGG